MVVHIESPFERFARLKAEMEQLSSDLSAMSEVNVRIDFMG